MSKGQATSPPAICRAAGLLPGTSAGFAVEDSQIVLRPAGRTYQLGDEEVGATDWRVHAVPR